MTCNLPFVSIGIPFFNAEDDLLNAIRSIYLQTHQNWELILINDGSTDKSLELANSINDPRIRVYSDGLNLGLAARLNQITNLAKYDFVARMDADDLISPNRIARQLRQFSITPEIDLVSTGVYSLDNKNIPYGRRCMPLEYEISTKALLAGNCGIVNASVIARRSWFLRNPFNEKLKRAQDANLWVQAYARDDLKVKILSDPLYYYREDNNVSEKRILSAYKVTRYSILNDAKIRYSNKERLHAYFNSLTKSVIIWILARLSKLTIIRNQRIGQSISRDERSNVLNIIKQIKATALPFEPVKR